MNIEIPGYVKGLIFDCDGTLVDSMAIHMEAWNGALQHAGSIIDRDFLFFEKGIEGRRNCCSL
jgi:beta-phosphoglucomutase-like phosphatase (HAD superfamily)